MDNNFKEDIRKFEKRWMVHNSSYDPQTKSYNYLNIGNNIEFDYLAISTWEHGGFNCIIHLRDQKQIGQSILADTLMHVREYIISETDQLQLSSGTMEFLKAYCESRDNPIFKVMGIVFDPGFQSHNSSKRDVGLHLSSMEIWFKNIFGEDNHIYDYLREKLTLKDFIFNPQSMVDRVTLTKGQTDFLNEKLFGLSNRLNQQKKFEILLKQFLKGGKTRLAIEIPMSDNSIEGKSIEVDWHYVPNGENPPYIRMEVNHGRLADNEKGSLHGHIQEDKDGHFVIHLTEESYRKLSQVDEPWPEIESYIISSFKNYIQNLLHKNHMSFTLNANQFMVVDH